MTRTSIPSDDESVYSADSHVIEPPDLWAHYLESSFADRAPRIERSITRADGTRVEGEFLVCEGIAPQPVASFAAADVADPRQRGAANQRGYAQIRAGGWDPAARKADQDRDGVALEIVYPSMAMPMFGLSDVAFQQALFRAYNAWVADFAAQLPGRLFGIAMIGVDDIDCATDELRRARELGLRGAMIPNDPGGGRTYGDAEFDPLWATAADLGMPVSLHILTGRTGTGLGRGPFLMSYMGLPHPTQLSLAAMLTLGVFARHPLLKIVSVENDIGWIAHFLYRLEHAFQEFRYLLGYEDPRSPVEYFQSNCYATFQDDPVGVKAIPFTGAQHLMWASDYPHGDSTWPESRKTIERNFEGIAPEVVRQITRDNVARLYDL